MTYVLREPETTTSVTEENDREKLSRTRGIFSVLTLTAVISALLSGAFALSGSAYWAAVFRACGIVSVLGAIPIHIGMGKLTRQVDLAAAFVHIPEYLKRNRNDAAQAEASVGTVRM